MLILASSSPRRKKLLKDITKDFLIIPSNINEREFNYDAKSYSYNLAKLKAYDVFSKHPNDTVLSCDTIVILNKKILNKPKDKTDAINMLKSLSNKKHIVITSYTIINKNKEINRSVKTEVYFNKLSESLIKKYINSGLYKGKAGGYGIQDNYPLVNHINGSLSNVIGFPLEEIKKDLNKFHY